MVVPRNVVLLPDAKTWFNALTLGKPSDGLMFERGKVERTKRAEALAGWDGWAEDDQIYAMQCAVGALALPQ